MPHHFLLQTPKNDGFWFRWIFPVTNRWLFGFKMLISHGKHRKTCLFSQRRLGVDFELGGLTSSWSVMFMAIFIPDRKLVSTTSYYIEHHVISISRQYQVTTNSPKTISPTFFALFTSSPLCFLITHTHTHSIGWTFESQILATQKRPKLPPPALVLLRISRKRLLAKEAKVWQHGPDVVALFEILGSGTSYWVNKIAPYHEFSIQHEQMESTPNI